MSRSVFACAALVATLMCFVGAAIRESDPTRGGRERARAQALALRPLRVDDGASRTVETSWRDLRARRTCRSARCDVFVGRRSRGYSHYATYPSQQTVWVRPSRVEIGRDSTTPHAPRVATPLLMRSGLVLAGVLVFLLLGRALYRAERDRRDFVRGRPVIVDGGAVRFVDGGAPVRAAEPIRDGCATAIRCAWRPSGEGGPYRARESEVWEVAPRSQAENVSDASFRSGLFAALMFVVLVLIIAASLVGS